MHDNEYTPSPALPPLVAGGDPGDVVDRSAAQACTFCALRFSTLHPPPLPGDVCVVPRVLFSGITFRPPLAEGLWR